MRIGLLGPIEVLDSEGGVVEVPGARLRALLIALALSPGRLVPRTQLIDAVWGDRPPATAGNSLQALVSRLRRALPDALIESTTAGYRLAVEPDAVDVIRFEHLMAAGRAQTSNRPDEAAARLRQALGLWRGPALLDVAEQPFFQGSITRLEELRLIATEDRVEAELRLGRAAMLVSELTRLAIEHPLRERLIGALMRALSESGRPAEALAVFERARAVLADQLGADPSPELSALHTAVLRGEVSAAPARTFELSRRTNLRSALTSFVGRDADLRRVGEMARAYRLTTLIGPGGSGKTRLAVEAARTLLDRMPDGVWLVELAPVTERADLASVIMAAIGLREPTLIDRPVPETPVDRLVAAMRSQEMLLVLDNCEHLVGSAAELADRLLSECARLRIIATSREPLSVTGEAVLPVGPLAMPPVDGEADAADLVSYDAVRLLVDRARAARPDFAVTADNALAVRRICRALDGMPLAIELAAARLRTMSVIQLAEGLHDRFRLLTGGSRTGARRHQTLRAAIDWSWELLSDAERALLRRLAIFSGGATLEAAEQVCAADAVDSDDLRDLLTGLVDKSLLVSDDDDDGAPRYWMLETIRAYGLERLDEAGEGEEIRRVRRTYFVELAEAAEPHMRTAEQLTWLRRLSADHDNINAALRDAISSGDAQTAARMVAAAGWYWWLSGHKGEGIELAIEALGVPGMVDDKVRAEACAMVAYFITAGLGDLRQAEPWIKQADQLARRVDHPGPLLRFVVPMGLALQGMDWAGGSALDVVQPLIHDEDPWVRAAARLSRTRMLPPEQRQADMEEALAEFRSIGERLGISYALGTLADLAARRGEFANALDYSREALAVISEIGAVEDLVFIRAKEAQVLLLIGDVEGAAAAMAEAERLAADAGWPDAVAGVAYFKAELARCSGDIATARTELAHAEAMLGHTAPDPVFRAMILDSQAYLDADEGDLEAAGALRAEALGIAWDSHDEELVSQLLVAVADQAVRQGQAGEAPRLLAAAELAGGGPDLSRPDSTLVAEAVRGALGESGFAEAMHAARAEFAGLGHSEPRVRQTVHELATRVLGR